MTFFIPYAICLGILTLLLINILFQKIVKKKKDMETEWGVFFITMIMGIAFLVCFMNVNIDQSYNTEKFELISLENQTGEQGNISGGGLFNPIRGEYGSDTRCVFVAKDENGIIRIYNVSSKQVTFRESNDSEARVTRSIMRYPYHIQSRYREWQILDVPERWDINIPSKNINKYIKFN